VGDWLLRSPHAKTRLCGGTVKKRGREFQRGGELRSYSKQDPLGRFGGGSPGENYTLKRGKSGLNKKKWDFPQKGRGRRAGLSGFEPKRAQQAEKKEG